MSIKDFLTPLRSKTTVLPEALSDTCSPSPFHSASSHSVTVIPDSQPRAEQKLNNSSSSNSQEDSSRLSRSQTLRSGLATMEDKEKEQTKTKVNAIKVNQHTPETKHHVTCTTLTSLPISPCMMNRLMQIPIQRYLEMSRELYKAQRKAKERKDRLWQLLLQRNAMQAIPTGPVAVVPSYTQALITSSPRIYPRELHSSSRTGYPESARRRRQRRRSERSTW